MAVKGIFDAGSRNGGEFWKSFGELSAWLLLCGLIYSQTQLFDREIPEYEFGVAGWPRVLCIAAALGAVAQFCLQRLAARRTVEKSPEAEHAGFVGWRAVAQRTAIFAFPLLWLVLAPRVGFYLSAPFFVAGMLVLMEVRSPTRVIAVTGAIYALVLLLFTRLFFVALPVGRIEAFYDANVAIIGFARIGL
ncbi:MAG: tripartite tricarboxylate transporter TctB family protein [Albidovulum sp.]|nr:tripartite tricarboxylate transporter TctB family protein [Albidovulum sp.]MDE0306981.1 tripartite tricarboxylate transporter TctB family protein [Albidovulum sp.]MDE0530853.1 tripartite tricarboxylate transporter TctB family protein [Albidovulum sp.]